MLKVEKQIGLCCGYGDLFMGLPSCAAYQKRIIVHAPSSYFEVPDLQKLVKIMVPNAVMCQKPWPQPKFAIPQSNRPYVPLYRLIARKWGLPPRISLSPEAVERVEPYDGMDDFILIHPISTGTERHYPFWEDVDLTGINYKVIKGWIDPQLLPGEQICCSFLHIARLLRTCKGILCVESCNMHLANCLRVPTVTIYPNLTKPIIAPCLGEHLVTPTPEQVRKQALRLLNGEVDVVVPYGE